MFSRQRTFDPTSYATLLSAQERRARVARDNRRPSPPAGLGKRSGHPGLSASRLVVNERDRDTGPGDGPGMAEQRSVQRPPRKEVELAGGPRQTRPNSSARREAGPPRRHPRQMSMPRGSTSVGPGVGRTGPLNDFAPHTDHQEQTSRQPARTRRKSAGQGSPVPVRRPQCRTVHADHDPSLSARELQTSTTQASHAGNGRMLSRGEDSEESDDEGCGLCGEDLRGKPRHLCQDCATLFCPACVVNAALLHPGHSIQATSEGRRGSPQTVAAGDAEGIHSGAIAPAAYECNICLRKLLNIRHECRTCADGFTLCANCVNIHPSHHHLQVVKCGAPDKAASPEPRRRNPSPATTTYECVVCEEQLSDLRYECQSCNVSLCHLCQGKRGLHPSDHELKAIRRGPMPHHNDEDGGDGDGEATTTRGARDVQGEDYVGFEGESDGLGNDAGEGCCSGTCDNGSRQDSEDDSEAGEDTDADQWPREPALRRSQRASQQPASVLGERPDASLGDPVRRTRGRPRSTRSLETANSRESSDYVLITREQFQQFTNMARAILRAGNTSDTDIDNGAGRPHGVGLQSNDLLHFTLEDNTSPPGRPRRQASSPHGASRNRRWTDNDKRRLRSLKRQGLDDTQIAAELNRTPGAVFQQWRKQGEE